MGATYYPTEATCKCQCLTPSFVKTDCKFDWQKNTTTNMVEPSVFSDYIKMKVYSAPDDMMEAAVVMAAQEFAEKAMVIREWIEFKGQKDVSDYYLTVDGDQRIHRVHKVWVDGICLPIGEAECLSGCSWGSFTFWYKDNGMIYISCPTINDCTTIKVEVSLVPTMEACHIDSRFFDLYRNAIVSGAVAELRTTDKAFGMADVSLAKAARQNFMFELSRAKTNHTANRKGTNRPVMRSGGMG